MPNKYVDPETGAIIYTSTPEEKKKQALEKNVSQLKKEVSVLKEMLKISLGEEAYRVIRLSAEQALESIN